MCGKYKFTDRHTGYFCPFHSFQTGVVVGHCQSSAFTASCAHNHKLSRAPCHPTLRAVKYLPTKIRGRNQTSFHLNNKRLHPPFNKSQIPKSIWMKVFDYQFPSNPRPWPSVASADIQSACAVASREEFHHTFISQANTDILFTPKQKERTQKDRILNFYVLHKDCFPECILFNNLALDWTKKCNIHTDKCPTPFHQALGGPRGCHILPLAWIMRHESG